MGKIDPFSNCEQDARQTDRVKAVLTNSLSLVNSQTANKLSKTFFLSQSCLSFFLSRRFVEILNEVFLVGVRRYICVLVQSQSGSGGKLDGGSVSLLSFVPFL